VKPLSCPSNNVNVKPLVVSAVEVTGPHLILQWLRAMVLNGSEKDFVWLIDDLPS
jgi:hypothetical protein